ncbi:MAG TPA: replication initiation factor domain-containing protein [Xylella sp.]
MSTSGFKEGLPVYRTRCQNERSEEIRVAASLYADRRDRREPFEPFPCYSGEKGFGPHSNTGQKGDCSVSVDFLTVILSREVLAQKGYLDEPRFLLYLLFGLKPEYVSMGPVTSRRWQFYLSSASILDANGDLVGKMGCDGNNDSFCISLTGAACRYIRDWSKVKRVLEPLGARITRCDVAYDDYDGVLGTVRFHEERTRQHLAPSGGCLLFSSGGTPPRTRFMDDHNNGSGCTLYVGQRGHKQLCIYEKGKQLGVVESPWVRYEVRLYAKHAHVPLDVLVEPMRYLRGSYDYIDQLMSRVDAGGGTRLPVVVKHVEATGEAMVRWLRRQVGPALGLLRQALGDSFVSFVEDRVTRDGLPSRFRGVCGRVGLLAHLRETLNPFSVAVAA